jgi:hypothetical protein
MNNLKFRTVLGIGCPKSFKHDILVFTRGATATITYDLGNKFYNLDSIDQITFIFKQGLNTFYFNMFNYLRETEDTEVVEDKVYYDVYELDQETKQCKATRVVNYTGNPKAAGYYELAILTDGEDNESSKYTEDKLKSIIEYTKSLGWEYILLSRYSFISADYGIEHIGVFDDYNKINKCFNSIDKAIASYIDKGKIDDNWNEELVDNKRLSITKKW